MNEYSLQQCCASAVPLPEDDMSQIPIPLSEKGISLEDWQKFTQRLHAINKTRKGYCNECVPCCLKAVFLPCCSYIWCRQQKEYLMIYDERLRSWQRDFNELVLERHGVYCKTRSHCWVSYNDKGERQRHFDRWIAFVLNESDIAALKVEPHLSGDVENLACCDGVNENECCIHPYN